MSADLLRKAAALMRERAEAATPGPWIHLVVEEYDEEGPTGHDEPTHDWSTPDAASEDVWFQADSREDAAHIASMHPGVAVAVADWLEAEAANRAAGIGGRGWFSVGGQSDAIAVARAYLGEAE